MMVHVDAVRSGLGEHSRCEARSRSNCQCGGAPASNSRRLTAVAANGTMQQLQRVDSRCLVDCSICHYLITALRR